MQIKSVKILSQLIHRYRIYCQLLNYSMFYFYRDQFPQLYFNSFPFLYFQFVAFEVALNLHKTTLSVMLILFLLIQRQQKQSQLASFCRVRGINGLPQLFQGGRANSNWFLANISRKGYMSLIQQQDQSVLAGQQKMSFFTNFAGICVFPNADNVDPDFYSAYRHLTVRALIKFTYLCIKAATAFWFFVGSQSNIFKIWLWLLFTVSLLQMPYFYRLLLALTNRPNFNSIATCLGFDQFHAYRAFPGDQILINPHRSMFTYNSDSQKISMHILVSQIEACVQRVDSYSGKLKNIQFVLYQIVQIYGVGVLVNGNFTGKFDMLYLSLILYIGTYECIEEYLCFVYGVVYLSYTFVVESFLKLLKRCQAYKVNRSLKAVVFSEAIRGDHDCQICLQPYEGGQELIVLRCSELHHFHAGCIRQWMVAAFTCPICRATVSAS